MVNNNHSRNFFHNQMLLISLICLLTLLSVIQSTNAIPLRKNSLKTITNEQIKTFRKFASYSSAAYCSIEGIRNWNCGPSCNDVPETIVIKAIDTPKTDTQVFIAKDLKIKATHYFL
jgi:hypothetical protein